MSAFIDILQASGEPAILVEIVNAKGSTPREKGAWVLVTRESQNGTIGGGQLEYLAVEHARTLLSQNTDTPKLDIPLGPEIGQCCGGRVEVAFKHADAETLATLKATLCKAESEQAHV
jgi:xanthine/CO dehydrogenase XdhC/CoxF family maturation factor